jgi:hypothetical protein
MTDALDVLPRLPLLLAPAALVEGWKRRVPRSHLELAGDAPRDVIAAQLGAYDTLLLARRGPVTLVHSEEGPVIVLGLGLEAAAEALEDVEDWEDADITFESIGGKYAIFQKPEATLTLDLPAGKYDGSRARTKVAGKPVIFVRIVHAGPRATVKRDVELPPELSDRDFAAAEKVEWTTLPDQVAVVVDAKGRFAPPKTTSSKPARAGDAVVVMSGFSLLSWPVAGGLLVAGSNLGDAVDNVAALLAIPPKRFVDTGLTLDVTSGAVKLFDPAGEEEDGAATVPLASGKYRVAAVEKFVTAAAELVSVLRLTKA